ncbi:hypothetical protein GGF37_007024, partial [Kickxella alabastrina]
MKFSVSTFALCAVLAAAAVKAQDAGVIDDGSGSLDNGELDDGLLGGDLIGDALVIVNTKAPVVAPTSTQAAALAPSTIPDSNGNSVVDIKPKANEATISTTISAPAVVDTAKSTPISDNVPAVADTASSNSSSLSEDAKVGVINDSAIVISAEASASESSTAVKDTTT